MCYGVFNENVCPPQLTDVCAALADVEDTGGAGGQGGAGEVGAVFWEKNII